MGDRESRPFTLPAGLGLQSTAVRLHPRPLPFHFSPASAWGVFGLRGRRYSWVREVQVRAPPEPALDVAAAMRQMDSMLGFWRDMPSVPDEAQLAHAELPRPFDFDELPPEPPPPDADREAVEARVRAEVTRAWPEPSGWPSGLAGMGLGAASGLACALVGAVPLRALLFAGGVGAALGAAALQAVRARRRGLQTRLVRRRLAVEWPAHQERAAAAWRFERNEWELRRAAARAGWRRAELARIARARRLRDGDAAASRSCVEATLADLDFPFECTCEVALGGDTAFLLVNLPRAAEVVPAVRAVVDERLEVEEVPVTPAERDETYAEMVAGVALLLGRAALAAAPAARKARIAAWRSRDTAPGVEYLLDVELDRRAATAFDPASVDPDAYLAILPGCFQQREDHRLAPLPVPGWIGAAFGVAPAAVADAAWKN